jgi:hypothetical protein
MRLVDQRIGVEPRVVHHSIDEVVHHGRDAVDAAEASVQRRLILRLLSLSHRRTPGFISSPAESISDPSLEPDMLARASNGRDSAGSVTTYPRARITKNDPPRAQPQEDRSGGATAAMAGGG